MQSVVPGLLAQQGSCVFRRLQPVPAAATFPHVHYVPFLFEPGALFVLILPEAS